MTIGRKSGGRAPGVKNRVSDAMRRDILSVYKSLGGRRWLLAWARDNSTEYVKQALSRVMPPMPRPAQDEAEEAPEFGMSLDNHDQQRALALRIAFILARHEASADRPVHIIEAAPVQAPEPAPELPPLDEAPTYPIPADLRGQKVIEETRTETLETYRGGSAERERSPAQVIDSRRRAHDDYMARLAAARYKRDLL